LSRALLLVAIGATAGGLYLLLRPYLQLEYLSSQEARLRAWGEAHPLLVYLVAFGVYVTVTGFSLPGATPLSLICGWYFGFLRGLLLVSFASTTGATIAFLLCRFLFRETVQHRFGDRLAAFRRALDEEGAFYLFTLRLIPVVPFFVINAVMGLTRLSVLTFWWVSQLGMLPATAVYVYAGASLPSLSQISDPSLLRRGDVVEWVAFCRQLRSQQPISDRVWNRLPADARRLVERIDQLGTIPAAAAELQLIAALNRLLQTPDLVLNSAWQTAPGVQVEVSESTPAERRRALTQLNRLALIAAFPDHVRPPQPILSLNLLIALALLGIFPIAVKRLARRLRPARLPAEPARRVAP
jgi:uncharacterized membrane protein YdjX (TVP38/TMEM64 family)